MSTKAGGTVIGRSVPRLEDRPLLTGRSRFAADISFPGQLHMRVVRSAIAHGRLTGIDTGAALKVPGVHAVWTAADVAHIPPIGFRLTGLTELEPYRQFVLARERVRYVGEPVAAVFASDPYAAEDAAELVGVSAELLPNIVDASEQPGFYDDDHGTEATVIRKGYGDVEAAFAQAQHIVELELSVGRHSGVPLETRGAVAVYDEQRDRLAMYGAAKVPHWNRDRIAQMLGRKPETVQLFEGHVGGGFGIRGELYPEDLLVCAAALEFRRPVKWIEDRREHLIAANHSRQQRHHVRAAVDEYGRILGIDDTFIHDNGAYMRTHAATVPDLAAAMLPGPYIVPSYRAQGHIRLTNKTPCGTYRAPGRYESTFVRERLMDAIAHAIQIDRLEVRRRNLIPKERMPYDVRTATLGTDVIYDSGDYAGLLRRLDAEHGLTQSIARAKHRRASGLLAGVGIAMFVEKSGLGPSDLVRVTLHPGGAIEVITGSASVGQGMETAMAQICADALGVDYADVHVVHGQTDRIERGGGAYASRVTVMTGEATHRAAHDLRAKALAAAAPLMQTTPDQLAITAGIITRAGGASMPLADVVRAAPLTGEGFFEYMHMVYPYGVHVAEVLVDAGSGGVKVERYLVGYDIGRAVNPVMVEGQITGGVAQGLGGALYEDFRYADNGEPLSVTFADYLMPTAREIPPIDLLLTEDAPSPLNSLGLKGAGEGGANAVGAAIASAVDDAIGIPGAITELPITPQRLVALLAHGRK